MGSLPPIAPFPPADFRKTMKPEEWEECLEAWVFLAQAYLRLSGKEFLSVARSDSPLCNFLLSYLRAEGHGETERDSHSASLKRLAFLLTHRVLIETSSIPTPLQDWSFFADLSRVYLRTRSIKQLFSRLWNSKGSQITRLLNFVKESIIKHLPSENAAGALDTLAPLLRVSPDAGSFFLTGSDFLDSVLTSFPKVSQSLQSKLVTTVYLCLTSLLEGERPNHSLFYDQFYTLKTDAESKEKRDPDTPSLLANLVAGTPILRAIRNRITGHDSNRARNLIASLEKYKETNNVERKRLIRRKIKKAKANDEYGHGAFGQVHVHRMSLITQIQDLFPDLGSGFVVKLLDEYRDDVEQVTAHLLDDSLPSHLQSADRREQLPSVAHKSRAIDEVPDLAPRFTPPLQRRNIFDNDEFDRLSVDPSRLHIGPKDSQATADAMLSERPTSISKAAILSALAAFDSDDDERDDTYDVEDVGGTVDSTIPGSDEANVDQNEESLFRAYSMTPDVYKRDAETRRGKARAALRSETGMTDESIEGWALMLQRDPRRLKRLEVAYELLGGQQKELARTKWSAGPAGSGDEAEGSASGIDGRINNVRGRGRGGGGARGGSGGGGGRGGTVSGPANEKDTQFARHRKEASKGSRANHDRRDQRARKMARGGLPG